AYNLIGDESARRAHLGAIDDLHLAQAALPADLRAPLASVVAHADVIAREVPAVDAWVNKVVNGDSGERLTRVERAYQTRFQGLVSSSNGYRRILYAWSLVLLIAVTASGLQLRRVYSGLERRVVERTAELGRALSALWGEMKLARKIQEALVPSAPSLAGCEVV